MREHLIDMLELRECDLQMLEQMGINLEHILLPYVQDDLVIEFIHNLNNMLNRLFQATIEFSSSLSFSIISSDYLDTLLYRVFGSDTFAQQLSRVIHYLSNARTYTVAASNGANFYIEAMNRLMSTFSNNGIILPIDLLRLSNYSSQIFNDTFILNNHVHSTTRAIARAMRHFREIYLVVTEENGDLYISPGVVLNYTEINQHIIDFFNAHVRVQSAIATVFSLVMRLIGLIRGFFRTRHNIDLE